MLEIARSILGVIGAVILMAVIAIATQIIVNANPTIHFAWFWTVGAVTYIVIIMFAISRGEQ